MRVWIFAAVCLVIGGAIYVNAQDMIVLKDGNMIEAKVMEISPFEIRYKRFDHLDGPTIVIPAVNVLSIRYENGTYEIITAGTAPGQEFTQTVIPGNTAIDPNKFIFGINANAGGAIGNLMGGPTGAGINIELGKGKFNTEINLMFLSGGFGALVTFNGFWPKENGGAYLGGGIGYSDYSDSGGSYYDPWYQLLTFGLNGGYKFVTRTGLYFRMGAFMGLNIDIYGEENAPLFYFKPDLSIGWTMR